MTRLQNILLKLAIIINNNINFRSLNLMVRKLAKVDKNLCAACGACAKVCPRAAISIYNGIHALVDSSKCIGCSLCAKECPASIISMEKLEVRA